MEFFRDILEKKIAASGGMEIAMTAGYVRDRITQLRIKKGVSEYKMSYDLGHSRGYINNISSGKALPSLSELFAICEYFNISVIEFFSEGVDDPLLLRETSESLARLSAEDLKLVEQMISRLASK